MEAFTATKSEEPEENESEEACAAVVETVSVGRQFNSDPRIRNNRGERGGRGAREPPPRGRFRNDGKCVICNKPGHFKVDCPMLKEGVELKEHEEGKSAEVGCELCQGPHRFNLCHEINKCKAEIKQELIKKDNNTDFVN